LTFFSKTNVMINFFSKFSFILSQKRQFFRRNFRRKYLKNHNIGPRWGNDEQESKYSLRYLSFVCSLKYGNRFVVNCPPILTQDSRLSSKALKAKLILSLVGQRQEVRLHRMPKELSRLRDRWCHMSSFVCGKKTKNIFGRNDQVF
jgi:hypothetical protein